MEDKDSEDEMETSEGRWLIFTPHTAESDLFLLFFVVVVVVVVVEDEEVRMCVVCNVVIETTPLTTPTRKRTSLKKRMRKRRMNQKKKRKRQNHHQRNSNRSIVGLVVGACAPLVCHVYVCDWYFLTDKWKVQGKTNSKIWRCKFAPSLVHLI